MTQFGVSTLLGEHILGRSGNAFWKYFKSLSNTLSSATTWGRVSPMFPRPLAVNPASGEMVDIKIMILDFLDRCNLELPQNDKHSEFTAECRSMCEQRGYIGEGDDRLAKFLPAGVCMARNPFAHQTHEVQVFICLYTTFLVWLDDTFAEDSAPVRNFNHRFVAGLPQENKILDQFAALLVEMHNYFGTMEASIIISSTLNFVTALLIEDEQQKSNLRAVSERFPAFSRVMSGASEAFNMFVFHRDIPIIYKLHCLPDVVVFINNGNDILSFYKEQQAQEAATYVCLAAQCRQVSQEKVLQELLDEAVISHQKILKTLRPHNAALADYIAFSQGYIGFHTGLRRYRLDELSLAN